MPADFLFPPDVGVNQTITLTGDSDFSANMLGSIVKLAGHTLSLESDGVVDGFFVVAGPGTLVLGEDEYPLTSSQTMFITYTAPLFLLVERPDVDLTAIPDAAIAIAKVSGLQTALDGKSATGHDHVFAEITGKPVTLAGYGITDAAHRPVLRSSAQGPPVSPAWGDNGELVFLAQGEESVSEGDYIEFTSDSVTERWTFKLVADPDLKEIQIWSWWPDTVLAFGQKLSSLGEILSAAFSIDAYDRPVLTLLPKVVSASFGMTVSNYGGTLVTSFAPSGGNPSVEPTPADAIGQWCRVGDIPPYDWWRWDGRAWQPSDVPWDSITGRPETYPPSAHSHPSADITDATPDGHSNRGKVLRTDGEGVLNLSHLSLGSAVAAPGEGGVAPETGMLALHNQGDANHGTLIIPQENTSSGDGAAPFMIQTPQGSGVMALTPNADGTVSYDSITGKPDLPVIDNTAVTAAIAENPAATRNALNLGTAALRAEGYFQRAIPGPFAGDEESALAGVRTGEIYKGPSGAIVWRQADEDAQTYATAVGLAAPELADLSDFLGVVKGLGFDPSLVLLGRSRFNSRDGASGTTFRSVIGPDATLTSAAGTLTNNAGGFGVGPSTRFQVANPIQDEALQRFSMIAVGSTSAVTGNQQIFGGYAGISAWGPRMRITEGTSPSSGLGVSQASNGATINNYSIVYPVVHGSRHAPLGVGIDITDGDAKMDGFNGGRQDDTVSGFAALTGVWNDVANLGIGVALPSSQVMTGEISLAMILNRNMTQAQWIQLVAAMKRFGIVDFGTNIVASGVGSSITAGDGANGFYPCAYQYGASAWATPFYVHFAQSGTGATAHETAWNTQVKPYLAQWPSDLFKHHVHIEFGRNMGSEGPASPVAAHREALADRAVAVAVEAKELGYRPFVHSYFYAGPDTTEAGQGYADAYNAYLAEQCEGAGVEFFDHRISEPEAFDWPGQDPALFSDMVHPNLAGQTRLAAALHAMFPDP